MADFLRYRGENGSVGVHCTPYKLDAACYNSSEVLTACPNGWRLPTYGELACMMGDYDGFAFGVPPSKECGDKEGYYFFDSAASEYIYNTEYRTFSIRYVKNGYCDRDNFPLALKEKANHIIWLLRLNNIHLRLRVFRGLHFRREGSRKYGAL